MLSTRRIYKTWWPLATRWLLMGVELPALSAFVARLPNSEINLAAYGGIVYSLALVVESPIIMLLAASTALSKDWGSYVKIRRFNQGVLIRFDHSRSVSIGTMIRILANLIVLSIGFSMEIANSTD